ncbi:MAG: hypothetical protein ACRDPY_01525 [Streptosporangiaceae bacterium]
MDPAGLNWTSVGIAARAEFLPDIFTGEFDFAVGLEKQSSWEVSTVSGSYHGSVNLGDLAAGLLGSHESVPAVLRGISFADFGVSATRPAARQPFDYTCYGNAQVALPLLGTELTARLAVVFFKTTDSYSVHLAGALAVGGEAFTLTLDLGTAGSKLQATWEATGQLLGFADLAAPDSSATPTTCSSMSRWWPASDRYQARAECEEAAMNGGGVPVGDIRFYQAIIPPLEDGNYTLRARQALDGLPGAEPSPSIPPVTLQFAVRGPRFTLNPADVHSYFPPPSPPTPFEGQLPHVVVARKTLPWERLLGPDPDYQGIPWLGLLLVDSGDPDGIPKVQSGTVADLLSDGGKLLAGTIGPALSTGDLDDGESVDDPRFP